LGGGACAIVAIFGDFQLCASRQLLQNDVVGLLMFDKARRKSAQPPTGVCCRRASRAISSSRRRSVACCGCTREKHSAHTQPPVVPTSPSSNWLCKVATSVKVCNSLELVQSVLGGRAHAGRHIRVGSNGELTATSVGRGRLSALASLTSAGGERQKHTELEQKGSGVTCKTNY
jgi:hypothetical protein